MLVIDQRPSGIDEEVMSQLGTKITCLLDNEKDVDAVLMGVAGKGELKSVLSKLESKQQALIFGHALPMPVVVKIREYGSADSYKELGPLTRGTGGKGTDSTIYGANWVLSPFPRPLSFALMSLRIPIYRDVAISCVDL